MASLDASPNRPMTSSPPASVLELADACVRYVERALGVTLDYAPETLSVLDHYVRSAADLGERPEARRLVASALAAYFGEVVRRRYDAWWHVPDGGDPSGWQLRFDRVYFALVPYAFAAAALDVAPAGEVEEEGGEEGGMVLDPAEHDDVAERLAALPPVEPDEYRLPTTRFEVVEIVVDHLRARAEAQGLGDVHLTDDDYGEPAN
jgi:hypothetical protein